MTRICFAGLMLLAWCVCESRAGGQVLPYAQLGLQNEFRPGSLSISSEAGLGGELPMGAKAGARTQGLLGGDFRLLGLDEMTAISAGPRVAYRWGDEARERSVEGYAEVLLGKGFSRKPVLPASEGLLTRLAVGVEVPATYRSAARHVRLEYSYGVFSGVPHSRPHGVSVGFVWHLR